MILSHVLSDLVLAIIGIGTFGYFHQRTPFYNRLLWGFFFLTISLAALAGVVQFTGYEAIRPLHESLQTLANSLGVVCVVMATWALLMRRAVGLVSFTTAVIIGLFLFVVLLLPTLKVFTPVVSSLGILVVMLLGVFGLTRRDARALWIIIAVMVAGLATKAPSFGRSFNAVDFYHYTLALSLFFFGKAAEPKDSRF